MSRIVDIGARDERKDDRLDSASRWVARMDRGLTGAEEEELGLWLAADRGNAEELLKLTRRWDRMESLSQLAGLFPEPEPHPPRRKRGPRLRWSVAAVPVVLLAAVATYWWAGFDREGPVRAPALEFAAAYETGVGEQATETLEDGTVVLLNTRSHVRVEYSADARILHLDRGEIHVAVARDASRPFSVVAGDRIVQAVGTAFSVQITDQQQIELTVTEGTVVVGLSSDASRGSSPPVLVQSAQNTVQAGEEVLLGQEPSTPRPLSAEEIEVKLSWREGRLVFRGEPLEAALAEMERYTEVRFEFLDDEIKTREVVGRFRTDDVDGLLLALRLNFDIAHERIEDGRVLLSSL